MRALMLCLLVINLVLALPRQPGEAEDCTLVLAVGSEEGVYQLWLRSENGEQLIHNNLTPDPDGMLRVTGLPQPGPGEQYCFRMIGAGEDQAFDPVPKPAQFLPF